MISVLVSLQKIFFKKKKTVLTTCNAKSKIEILQCMELIDSQYDESQK